MAVNDPQGEEPTKVFNDSVHGHIEMHPLLVKIIDTPEFQRLRNVKQLGGGYYVFPGASHNRFEHSLGVAHLARKLLESLKKKLPKGVEITPKDELCVQIAALCHDLGHGPFSHVFEAFMKKVNSEWRHEDQSVRMLEHLFKENGIKDTLEKTHAFTDQDFIFINELIKGPSQECESASEWPYEGRERNKAFLYEIVANHRNGIDVDKMDYFSRDCHHLGMKSNFSYERFITFARVCEENGKTEICMRDKEAMNMYELFHVRNLLHHNAYQHRVKTAVELMIMDAFKEANEHMKISEAAVNPESFVNLTDDLLQTILRTQTTELKKAHNIIRRILKHDLYKFIGGQIFEPQELDHLDSDEKREAALKTWLERIRGRTGGQINPEDFEVVLIKFSYGMNEQNPIDSLRFYRKEAPQTPIRLFRDQVSHLLPGIFAETKVMLFYKGKDPGVFKFARQNVEHFWEI